MLTKFLALASAGKLDGKEVPTRLLIVPWDKTETNQGPVICNATTAGELPANQARRKRDRIALDFQHNTVEGSQLHKGEPAKVAAFASLEIVEGEGSYLTNIEWTPEVKAFAADGHYPDLARRSLSVDEVWSLLIDPFAHLYSPSIVFEFPEPASPPALPTGNFFFS